MSYNVIYGTVSSANNSCSSGSDPSVFLSSQNTSIGYSPIRIEVPKEEMKNLEFKPASNSSPPTLSLAPPPTFPPQLNEKQSEEMKRIAGVIAELANEKAPQFGKALDLLDKAGVALESVQAIKEAVQNGKDPLQAIVCESLKIGTEQAIGAVGHGALMGGVPVYLGHVMANPPLVLTVPLAAQLLIEAQDGVDELAKKGGEKAQQDCDALFAVAKAIAKGGERESD